MNAAAVTAQNDAAALIPELGDFLTIQSALHGRTTGRIVYRDGTRLLIRPIGTRRIAVEFRMDEESGMFLDVYGVTEIILHEKRADPHFSKQLFVGPGSTVELCDAEGAAVAPGGVVAAILATEDEDALVFEDGRTLAFDFLGPAPPIALVIPVASAAAIAAENESAAAAAVEANVEEDLSAIPDVEQLLSYTSALVEEVPSEERMYSDTLQREDMFVSLLVDEPLKRQKDPRIMAKLYRTSDLLLALKNSVVPRDAFGAVAVGAPTRSYVAETVLEAIAKQPDGDCIPAVLPVAAVEKQTMEDGRLLAAWQRATVEYERAKEGEPFFSYASTVFDLAQPYVPTGPVSHRRLLDADVLRTALPDAAAGVATSKDNTPTVVRLIGPTRVRNPITGALSTVAPGDSADSIERVLLTPYYASMRAPTRSSMLLWDILASEQSRARLRGSHALLHKDWADQTVLGAADVLLQEEFQKRMLPATQILTRQMLEVLDVFGLKHLELTEEIFAPIDAALNAGKTEWDVAFAAQKRRTLAALEEPAAPLYPPTTAATDALFGEVLQAHTPLQNALVAIQEKELLLRNDDLVLANGLLQGAGATLGQYWYAILGGQPDRISVAEREYLNEYARMDRVLSNRRIHSTEFRAAPDLNRCPHVHAYERVSGVRDDAQRMVLFEQFLKTYQGGQRDSYILCGVCNKDLVCKHEVLLLHEFQHPGRGQVLHKNLLLEFSGPVFEGAYICKVCGQKIQDIEYDTHLEFDDEGRPLVGRTVVQTDAAEEAMEDLADGAAVGLRDEVVATIPFTGADLSMYYMARTVFERCGMVVDMETYGRVVAAAQEYCKDPRRVPSRAVYEDRIQKLAQSGKKAPAMPPYDTFFANHTVGVLGALVVLELQTSNVHIPFPPSGCTVERSGFPLDGDAPDQAGKGAVQYVTCVIAGMLQSTGVWTKVSWAQKTRMEDRLKEVDRAIVPALFLLLCILMPGAKDVPPPLPTATDVYKTRLQTARATRSVASLVTERLSASDAVPPNFRPIPMFVGSAGAPADLENAIQNLETFQSQVNRKAFLDMAPYVATRAQTLTQQVLHAFHTASDASAVRTPQNPRSDSAGGFIRLGAAALSGLGYAALPLAAPLRKELDAVQTAAAALVARDSASSAASTHIYVPWSAPEILNMLPSPDPSNYYKLFMKHCYAGRAYGRIHEFNVVNICRNCGFAYPTELTYLSSSELVGSGKGLEKAIKEQEAARETIAKEALATQGVEINEDTFRALEIQVRQQRSVYAHVPERPIPVLEALDALAKQSDLLASAPAWQTLLKALKTIGERNLVPGTLDRKLAFGAFVEIYDALKARVDAELKRQVPRGGAGAAAVAALETATATIVGNRAIQNVQQIFVVCAAQIAHGFVNAAPHAEKWFESINRSHKETLQAIWNDAAAATRQMSHTLNDLDRGDARPNANAAKHVLSAFSRDFGTVLTAWMRTLRPSATFTEEELQYCLRWVVYTYLDAGLSMNSVFYAGIASPDARVQAVKFFALFAVTAVQTHTKAFAKYQMSEAQIQEALHARAELEKARFIKVFDDLDQDLRKVELMKKKLKIGDWAVATKNLFSYDADFFEFQRIQREQMGLPEYESYAGGGDTGAEEGYEHRGAEDEDAA